MKGETNYPCTKNPWYLQEKTHCFVQRKVSLRKREYILLKNHCSFCWKVECIFPKGPIICLCSYIPMNTGNSYGMGVGVGQLKSEGLFFFLVAKENKFYSPGTTQQFLPWSIKHSQKSVGVLAEKGAEFLVELVAPYNALACNVLQICAWAGKGMKWTLWFRYRSWAMGGGVWWSVQTNGVALGLDVHSHTAAP